jgi:hypothetical protein
MACGKTLGHNEYCAEGYCLCDQCKRIAALEAKLEFMAKERDYLLETPDPKNKALREAALKTLNAWDHGCDGIGAGIDSLREALKVGWTITYNPKPIPTRDDDWDYVHDDYDGENGLRGTAGSYLDRE